MTSALFRLALLAFSRRFRDRYGAEMLDVFLATTDRIRQREGPLASARHQLRSIGDVVASGVAERLSSDHPNPRPLPTVATSLPSPPERPTMHALRADVSHALRVLLRRPGYALVAVGTLAVGIGASAAMFTLVDRVILRALPFPEPNRLVRIFDTHLERGQDASSSSPITFHDWRRETKTFASLAAQNGVSFTYTGVTPAELVRGARVSAEWLDVLGTRPILGRGLTREEETLGRDRVALVSHAFWQRHLGGDSAAVGRTLPLDGEPFEIVGVMPAEFAWPTTETEIWAPLAFDFDVATSRGVHYLEVFGRLGPGTTLAGAEEDLRLILRQAAVAEPEKVEGWDVRVASMHEALVGSVQPRMFVYLGAVGLVLLIAGVNVTNLTLANAVGRTRELAVRSALGAGRWRLGRQLVVEGLVVAGLAGLLGIGVARLILTTIIPLAPGNLPRLEGVTVSASALALAAVLALVLGACLGLVPILRIGRAGMTGSLRDAGRSGGGRGHHGLRNGFVVAQFALAVLLTVGAGLLVRSYAHLADIDPGYSARDGLVATVSLPSGRYGDPAAREAFLLDLTARLDAQPGVLSSAASTQLPLEYYGINFSFWVAGAEVPVNERASGDFRVVTPGYFETMGIPLLAGRTFGPADVEGSAPVVVVDETLAKTHFGTGDAVGRQIVLSYGEEIPRTIIGVVGAVRQRTIDAPPVQGYYLPLGQASWSSFRIVVRTRGPADGMVDVMRREVAALDPLLALRGVQTLEQRFAASLGVQRFNTFLLGAFAVFGLVLAVSGIYSVMSYVVTQRTRDIGVRMALGARAAEVRRSVTWSGVRLAALGVGIGVGVGLAATRLLANLLFGVSALDPLTFAVASAGFVAVGWLGSFVPARRASSVDPMVALRAD